MEKIVKKYGVVIVLYIVLVGSVVLLNERFRTLNLSSECISQSR